MRTGKYQAPKRRLPAAILVLLILAAPAILFGGVAAYLSASADPVSNELAVANHPTVSVGDDYAVNVGEPGYAVYVRAAVVVNWTNGDNILATVPTEYTMTMGDNWFEHGGFWYYEEPIYQGATDPLIAAFSATGEKTGYTLTVDVIAQTIQAVGTTDVGENPAVTDAWGISVANGKLVDPTP